MMRMHLPPSCHSAAHRAGQCTYGQLDNSAVLRQGATRCTQTQQTRVKPRKAIIPRCFAEQSQQSKATAAADHQEGKGDAVHREVPHNGISAKQAVDDHDRQPPWEYQSDRPDEVAKRRVGIEKPASYGPQEPPSDTSFFQGWYTRITAKGGMSVAVILGKHRPGPPGTAPEPKNPPVLCTVLVQPGVDKQGPDGGRKPLVAYTRYFNEMSMTAEGPTEHKPPANGKAAKDSPATQTGQDNGIHHSNATSSNGNRSGNSTGGGKHPSPVFTARTVGPAITGAAASGKEMGEAASKEEDFCQLSVDKHLLTLEVNFPGVVQFKMHSTNGEAVALPWSEVATSPEGWVGLLGSTVGLHYCSLSLRTPVDWQLWLGENSGADAGANGKVEADSKQVVDDAQNENMTQSGSASKMSRHNSNGNKGTNSNHETQDSTKGHGMDVESQHSSTVHGPGVAHCEAQFGRGFPPRWLWIQGAKYPDDGFETSSKQNNAGGASFVLAGGDLPHVLSPPLPPAHQYLFSYRDTARGVDVSIDPWNPSVLGVKETIDPDHGRIALHLPTLTHVVEVEVKAPPSSFTPVDCPTEAGFQPLSDESFIAKAKIKIWEKPAYRNTRKALGNIMSAATTGLMPDDNQHEKQHQDSMRVKENSSSLVEELFGCKLIVDTEMDGVALEFGAEYRSKNSKTR